MSVFKDTKVEPPGEKKTFGSAGGILIVVVCFQPWEAFPSHPLVPGQKEDSPLLKQSLGHPQASWRGGGKPQKKALCTPKWLAPGFPAKPPFMLWNLGSQLYSPGREPHRAGSTPGCRSPGPRVALLPQTIPPVSTPVPGSLLPPQNNPKSMCVTSWLSTVSG